MRLRDLARNEDEYPLPTGLARSNFKINSVDINLKTMVVGPSTTAISQNRCIDYRTNCFQYVTFCTNPRHREVLSR